MECANYKKPLKLGNTLEIYSGNSLIYESKGKWLYPLFEFLREINNFEGKYTESPLAISLKNKKELYIHDTAIGKAAAVLMIKIGATKIHGNIVSSLAVKFIEDYNKTLEQRGLEKIEISWEVIVPSLLCATEKELSEINDLDEMFSKIKKRVKSFCGVSVDVSSINYSYGNINNLSFSLKAGEHLMVVGENGAGKTTLLKMLAGIYTPTSGTIVINGVSPENLPKYTIGYIPQQIDNEDFSLSVEEVVGLGVSSKKRTFRHQLIKKSLERAGALHLIYRDFCTLSGGEKQKVSIARCLAQNAKLLILDEPTAALDEENRKIVINIVKSLTVSESPTIIISTHDKDLVCLEGWRVLHV